MMTVIAALCLMCRCPHRVSRLFPQWSETARFDTSKDVSLLAHFGLHWFLSVWSMFIFLLFYFHLISCVKCHASGFPLWTWLDQHLVHPICGSTIILNFNPQHQLWYHRDFKRFGHYCCNQWSVIIRIHHCQFYHHRHNFQAHNMILLWWWAEFSCIIIIIITIIVRRY